MENCGPLMEYSWFVDKIREYQKDDSLEEAMRRATEGMPDDFRIKRFLIAHMEEIKGMLDIEYNEAEVNEAFREEGRAEGRDEAITGIIINMLHDGKTVEEISDLCHLAYDQVKKVEEELLTTVK